MCKMVPYSFPYRIRLLGILVVVEGGGMAEEWYLFKYSCACVVVGRYTSLCVFVCVEVGLSHGNEVRLNGH